MAERRQNRTSPHSLPVHATAHTHSPLYPAIAQLSAIAGLHPQDEPVDRARKIREALPNVDAERVALVTNLLGVPLAAGSPLEKLTPRVGDNYFLRLFRPSLKPYAASGRHCG